MGHTMRLPDESLEFARAHIDTFHDSDFFPPTADFDILGAMWSHVKSQLASLPVTKESIQPARAMAAPKSGGGYRIVHQLEPLNAVAYTAVAHSLALAVEAARVSESKQVSFSYRIKPDDKSFFASGNGYNAFIDQCRVLAGHHEFVLVTDIADFYNSIYLHRLQGALELTGPNNKSQADALEKFLLFLNQKASQGIPVGPAASIVMAEATLIDVDAFIELAGLKHTRYVDDLRLFGDSEEELRVTEERLVMYLYEHHRLQLSPLKTKLIKSEQFIRDYLDPPASAERRELLDAARATADYGDTLTDEDINELEKKYLQPNNPSIKMVDQSARTTAWGNLLDVFAAQEEQEKRLVRGRAFCGMLHLALSQSRLDMGLARYALRRSRTLGEPEVVPVILGNMDALAPILPDAVLCLHRLTTPELIAEFIEALRVLPRLPLFRKSEFAKHWLFWYLTSHRQFIDDAILGPQIWRDAPLEHQARAARATNNLAWIRQQKSRLRDMTSWDRRATLIAAAMLPSAERNAWLSAMADPNPLSGEAAIVKWLRQR